MPTTYPKTWLFMVLFSFRILLPAQETSQLDSLKRVLETSPEDTNKVRLYFQLYELLAFNEPQQAEAYIWEALPLAKSLNDQRGIILCYDKLGGSAMMNSDFKKAIHYYRKTDSLLQFIDWPREQAIIYGNYAAIFKDLSMYDSSLVWLDKFKVIAESIKNSGFIAYALNLKGDIYHLRGQHELSTRNYLEALRIYEDLDQPDRLADTYRLLGATQTAAGNYSDAEFNLEKAIKIYLEVDDQYYLSQAYRDLGYAFSLQEQYDKSKENYLAALEISQKLEDLFGLAQVYGNLGELAYFEEQYEVALQQQRQALKIYLEIGDGFSEGLSRIAIAKSLIKQEDYTNARSELESAEVIVQQIGSPVTLKYVYKGYYDLYQALGRTEEALRAFELYNTIKDSLNSVEKTRQFEELQIIYKVEKKDQEIQILSKDVALGKLRRQLLTFGILGVSLIAALIIYLQYYRRRQEKKIQEERHRRQALELEKNQIEKSQLERELASQVLQLCRKNELLSSLQQEISLLSKQSTPSDKPNLRRLERTISSDIQSDDDWKQFLATFEKVHPDFLAQLRNQTQKLSPAEQRLSCLFKMNLSSKEIATLLNISDEGVKKARYRLRKKLDLSSDVNLQEYLINFPDKVLSN